MISISFNGFKVRRGATMIKRVLMLSIIASTVIMSGCSLIEPENIEVSPDSIVVYVGQSVEFTALATLPGGGKVAQPNFIWEISENIGSLSSASGFKTSFTGEAPGSCLLTVYNYDKTLFDSASIEVKEPIKLTRIVVEPSTCTLGDGETREFTATGYDQYDQPFAFNPAWRVIGNIGSLSSASGLSTILSAVNLGPGEVSGAVQATSGAITGSSSVTVTPPPPVLTRIDVSAEKSTMTLGETCRLLATGYDQYGNIYAINPQWSAPGDVNGIFSPTQGEETSFQPSFAQKVTIHAACGKIEGTAEISVDALIGSYFFTIDEGRIPDNNTLNLIKTVSDANPKAKILFVHSLMISGGHENPSELTADLAVYDPYSGWRFLPTRYGYTDPSYPTIFFVEWIEDTTWEGAPLNTDYFLSIRDNAAGNTGYLSYCMGTLVWKQTEL